MCPVLHGFWEFEPRSSHLHGVSFIHRDLSPASFLSAPAPITMGSTICITNSNALTKEISHMCAQCLTSRVTSDPVRLTAKVILHGGMRRMMVKMRIPRLLSNQRRKTAHSAFAFHLTSCFYYFFFCQTNCPVV